jgi:hypothetical protein
MIALIRKNLRLWGYGKSLALFTGCILFSISGRLNGGIAYERHILSAVSDHYYLTYFVLPIVLLSCFSFIDDDGEPVILRFQSYHSYFLKKWIGVGLIAVILTAVQTGAILLSGIGLPLGNEWNLAAGATEAELFSTLEQLFASPLQAFVCFTLYQLIGSWLIFGICMWIGHFTERKWTIRIVIVLYVLSAVWIKLPAIQNIPLTSFNHLLILHHNFGEPARPWITGFTLLLFMLTIMFSVRFAWRGHLPQLRLKCHGIAAYYSYELMTKRNILILLAVVVGITLYKGLGYGAAESDAEWIYSLFAGHGTGYFQVFPFLEMLITSGVPLYLLAAFVEHTVNGQSIFISVRAKSRRHLVKGILSVSTKFLIIYAFFWLMAGLTIPAEEDGEEDTLETWYIYTIRYNGEAYFADTIFALTDEQKSLAENYAENLSLFLGDGLFQYAPSTNTITALGDVRFTDGETEVIYFNQLDERYANQPYGTDHIGGYGCGPTSMAIVVSSLTGETVDPAQMARWAYEHGYWCSKSGSYHTLIPGAAQAWGLSVEGCTASEPQRILDALADGKLVVALMTKGHFTKSGHFIVLRGVQDEKILVADPASYRRSQKTWDLSIILNEASRRAGAGGPFWIIGL